MQHYKGASHKAEVKITRRRKDTRPGTQKLSEILSSKDGSAIFLLCVIIFATICTFISALPFAGENALLILGLYWIVFVKISHKPIDFPLRVPLEAGMRDGSTSNGKKFGEGITILGNDTETGEQIYASDSDMRTHQLVLGTTGSGKTEYLLGLLFNALIQNTGCIYCDGKGDPALLKNIFRLARRVGREDDLLVINFITSGRDFIDHQMDKVTNTMNMMGNTSSGMLIELIVALMDDSGGGSDIWKGRAISFVAALTRPLVYLRDKGHINLAPVSYLDYFELGTIEELVWNHRGIYGETFDIVCAPLRLYLLTLPGYQREKIKKQESKTLEQHGYIVMQLTRIFNDLTFNYGHIFKVKIGDVDFYDVVINRRLLVVLLPALERAPDSMRMLGKMIVGSIKQMMAGCLGNRVEGLVREIIDSRPTNASVPFYVILDEYGYYAVIGFAVAPAQARSLGFSMIFAAQDFSSLKKSSSEEADATWENTNIRAIGRITSGQESETWKRVEGVAGEVEQAFIAGFERSPGVFGEVFRQQDNIGIHSQRRIHPDDLAMQADGEFHILVGKKENAGQSGGVRVIRAIGLYTSSGPTPKEMRINDFLPIEPPDPADLPDKRRITKMIETTLKEATLSDILLKAMQVEPLLTSMSNLFQLNYQDSNAPLLSRPESAAAVMHWFLTRDNASQVVQGGNSTATQGVDKITDSISKVSNDEIVNKYAEMTASNSSHQSLSEVCNDINENQQAYANVGDRLAQTQSSLWQIQSFQGVNDIGESDSGVEETFNNSTSTSIVLEPEDADSFKNQALPLLKLWFQHEVPVDALDNESEYFKVQLSVGDIALLKEIDLLGRSTPYESLEAKWDAEAQALNTRKDIAQQTTYVSHPPLTDKIDATAFSSQFAEISEKCKLILKQTIVEPR